MSNRDVRKEKGSPHSASSPISTASTFRSRSAEWFFNGFNFHNTPFLKLKLTLLIMGASRFDRGKA